jgi:hypothetical protein
MDALEGTPSARDIIDILQGFRQRKSKDLYMRVRKSLIERKSQMFPTSKDNLKARAEEMVNLIYSFASNRPTNFGVYKVYAAEEVDEMLSHYDQDLKDAVAEGHLDADHLTRLAQAFYVLKTDSFEGIFRRIEKRAVALNAEGKLDAYHVTNILRSFSHS